MIEVLLAAQFVTVTREDPISLEPQAFYGISEDGHTFGLACRPGRGEIAVRFVPDGYRGPARYVPTWHPRADSRLGRQDRADEDSWGFAETYLNYTSRRVLGSPEATARFIDQLAQDDTFNIRYEAWPGDVRTVTLHYAIDHGELQRFIAMCGPQRVIRHLRQMGSPAAPPG